MPINKLNSITVPELVAFNLLVGWFSPYSAYFFAHTCYPHSSTLDLVWLLFYHYYYDYY